MAPDAAQGPGMAGAWHHRPWDDRSAARGPVACLALLGHGAPCGPARRRTPPHAPLQRRRRHPAPGAGHGATRPRRARAPGDGDTPPAPSPAAARGYHDGRARRMVRTPHPPARAGPPVGTMGRTPAAWGLACRWAWDGLGCGGADYRDTRRVVWGGHAWSAFSPGHARQQRCAQQPNARLQARRVAGATQERRLFAVACPGRAGGYPTGPPTDPYVRLSLIRFLGAARFHTARWPDDSDHPRHLSPSALLHDSRACVAIRSRRSGTGTGLGVPGPCPAWVRR